MNIKEILSKVDHTLLSQTATWQDVKKLCDEAVKYGCKSVCVAPSYVKRASEYLNGKTSVCTVIGFPNGYMTTACKCFEANEAVNNGADEIDMVINLGMLKDKDYEGILSEINMIKASCNGKLLKVIIETCLLTDEEKIKMCEIVNKSDADYIKTSTGFSSGGATKEDIELFSLNICDGKKIKAAGGISSLEDATEFIKSGASRLGTSRIIKIVEQSDKTASVNDY